MAQSTVSLAFGSGLTAWKETALGGTKEQIKGSSGTIYEWDLDNSANAAITYFKVWYAASGSVTVGTTDPDEVIMVPASTRIVTLVNAGTGKAFSNGMTVAAVTAGGTGGTTSPNSSFIAQVAYA